VVQGMDTSGKGGIMRHVVGSVDPQGVSYTAFKAPTKEEREHPFLWRIRKALPGPGQIGVFDRSHYEDVLIARVHNLVSPATWGRRYGQINSFEETVTRSGTIIVKVMLHISSDEQKARLTERLERPEKHWKYNPADVDEREHWPAYQQAYQVAIDKCSTQDAPWFVIPADRKWYSRLAVQQLVVEHLRTMAPQWPAATFDVEAEKARLAQT
jgi:PPK2 family polyphosphate:nucleotide phosphotransferase